MRKRRRISRFSLAGGRLVARAQKRGHEPGCEVELTEIRTSGQDWWSLGFEATGPVGLLRSQLQATAAHVFAQALPGSMQPSPDHSRSYPQWLGQQPGAGYGRAPDGRPSAGPTGPAAVLVHPGLRRIHQQADLSAKVIVAYSLRCRSGQVDLARALWRRLDVLRSRQRGG